MPSMLVLVKGDQPNAIPREDGRSTKPPFECGYIITSHRGRAGLDDCRKSLADAILILDSVTVQADFGSAGYSES